MATHALSHLGLDKQNAASEEEAFDKMQQTIHQEFERTASRRDELQVDAGSQEATIAAESSDDAVTEEQYECKQGDCQQYGEQGTESSSAGTKSACLSSILGVNRVGREVVGSDIIHTPVNA